MNGEVTGPQPESLAGLPPKNQETSKHGCLKHHSMSESWKREMSDDSRYQCYTYFPHQTRPLPCYHPSSKGLRV